MVLSSWTIILLKVQPRTEIRKIFGSQVLFTHILFVNFVWPVNENESVGLYTNAF